MSLNISITIPLQAKQFVDREAKRKACSRSAYISLLIKEAEARAYTQELNEWQDLLSEDERAAEEAFIDRSACVGFSSLVEADPTAQL